MYPSLRHFVQTQHQGFFDSDGRLHLAGRIRDRYRMGVGSFDCILHVRDCALRQALIRWRRGVWGFGLACPSRTARTSFLCWTGSDEQKNHLPSHSAMHIMHHGTAANGHVIGLFLNHHKRLVSKELCVSPSMFWCRRYGNLYA